MKKVVLGFLITCAIVLGGVANADTVQPSCFPICPWLPWWPQCPTLPETPTEPAFDGVVYEGDYSRDSSRSKWIDEILVATSHEKNTFANYAIVTNTSELKVSFNLTSNEDDGTVSYFSGEYHALAPGESIEIELPFFTETLATDENFDAFCQSLDNHNEGKFAYSLLTVINEKTDSPLTLHIKLLQK